MVRFNAAITLGVVLALVFPGRLSAREAVESQPAIWGIDHIPVAVDDLEAAAERFRQLGFALKPGRPHENGIRNEHVKFEDGTELELITAPEPVDALTTEYREHLKRGDGPAFLSLFAPDTDALAARLEAAGLGHYRNGGMVTFPQRDARRYIFFGRRNKSPTDRPEHFEHANGAESLIGVWLASDDFSVEKMLLNTLGVSLVREEANVPHAASAEAAYFGEGHIVFLSAGHQRVPGRKIVGAVFRCRSTDQVLGVLRNAPADIWDRITVAGRSVFLPPEVTHGVWIEFREVTP